MSFGGLENYVIPIVATAGLVAVAIALFFATRNRKVFEPILKSDKEPDPPKAEEKPADNAKPLSMDAQPSMITLNMETIKGDLRVMDVEKEIVGYALTRLYEAQAEGKITEGDRSQLLGKYEGEMKRLDKEIEKKQMVVKLHDLEETKANLVSMFQSKLEEISNSIDDIRATLGIAPAEPVQPKTPQPRSDQEVAEDEASPAREKKVRERPAPKPRVKSKTEEKMEAVQEEVLKVLERLEQIEIEDGGEGNVVSGEGEEAGGSGSG